MQNGGLVALVALCFVPAGARHAPHEGRQNLIATVSASLVRLKMAPKSGDLDRDFASMMSEQHRLAIEIAQVELHQGRDPVLRQMAKNIVVTETREMHRLNRRARVLLRQSHARQGIGSAR